MRHVNLGKIFVLFITSLTLVSCGPSHKKTYLYDDLDYPSYSYPGYSYPPSSSQPSFDKFAWDDSKADLTPKAYEMIWADQIVSNQYLFDFIGKDENQIVSMLRAEKGLKVLILSSPEPANPSLSIGNLAEDEAAVPYYDCGDDDQCAIQTERHEGSARGQYIQPYMHSHSDKKTITRPYFDKPLLLIRDSAPRSTFIHEYIHHFQFSNFYAEDPIEIDGNLHSPECQSTFAFSEYNTIIEDDFSKMKKLKDKVPHLAINQHEQLKAFLLLYLNSHRIFLTNLELYPGSEIDVYRTLYDQKNIIGLTSEQAVREFDKVNHYVKMIKQRLLALPEANDFIGYFDAYFSSDETVTKAIEDFRKHEKRVRKKLSKTKKWYDARLYGSTHSEVAAR